MITLNITAHMDAIFEPAPNSHFQFLFQLRCDDTVLIEEKMGYGMTEGDLKFWAAEKLKGLFE